MDADGGDISRITVIIPALNPDGRLPELIDSLIRLGFRRITVVNDGSAPEYGGIFADVGARPGVRVLAFPENRGKGAALRCAFADEIASAPEQFGCVTADADGQHRPDDIAAAARKLLRHPDALIMGVRSFASENVPLKSRFGNWLTRKVFRIFSGVNCSDTQTGLRAMGRKLMAEAGSVPGDRYEFESRHLLTCAVSGVPLVELPIATVYENGNSGTHFRPIVDGVKIYASLLAGLIRQFSLFILGSLLSAGLDLSLYAAFYSMLGGRFAHGIVMAAVPARVLSAGFNYTYNLLVVFSSKVGQRSSRIPTSIAGYAALCVTMLLLSCFFTEAASRLMPGRNTVWIKALVDFILFLAGFAVQKFLIFRKS